RIRRYALVPDRRNRPIALEHRFDYPSWYDTFEVAQMPRASGACMRSMVVPTSSGIERRVASEPATITVKASGTVHAAGWWSRMPAHPLSGGPIIVVTTAAAAAPPPATRPAKAPAGVRPRHHRPSTSSGQKLDAATAKASPTTWDTFRPPAWPASSMGT